MKAARFLKRARIVVYVAALFGVLFLILRYETLRLPREGCSPLRDFVPGTRLLLDRWRTPAEGDAVLFRVDDELLLGRIEPFPQGLPDELPANWSPFDADHVWIVADDPNCPAVDSRSLGPVDREALVAVVAAAMPW